MTTLNRRIPIRRPASRPPSAGSRWVGSRRLPYLLLAPAAFFELLIHIIPLLAGIGFSFKELNEFFVSNWSAAPWTGLRNYGIALNFAGPIGQGLLHSFLITLAFTAMVVTLSVVLGMAGALLVNAEFRGQRWFRTLFLIPYALPVYVAVIVWSFLLDRDHGAINTLLVNDLHLLHHRPFWLIGANAFWSIVMTDTWRLWPFALLMILAGMQNIPQVLYDAAAVDGAGPIRQFRSITLPLLRPVTRVLVIILFLWTFNEFNTPYVLFGQAPPSSADLISLHIYVNSFVDLNFGLGSAMSVLLLIFLMVTTLVYVRVVSLEGEQLA